MTNNVEIMKQAQALYNEWEDTQETRFWLDFFTLRTGFELGDAEYELVAEMTHDGLL